MLEAQWYLNERVIQDKHDGCEIPRDSGVEKEHLSNVANISSFRMSQAELPDEVLACAEEWLADANLPDNE